MIDRSYHFFSFLRKLIEQYFKNEEVKRIIRVVTHRVMHSTSNRKFIIQIIVNNIILALNSNLLVLSNEMMLRVAKIFRERRSTCRSEQVDVFSNFNRLVIIIIRK
jgi:hypothetical protein